MPAMIDSSQKQLTAIGEKCPCFPRATAVTGSTVTFASGVFLFYAEALSHPACFSQVEAQYRISFDRARQKRGPPLHTL